MAKRRVTSYNVTKLEDVEEKEIDVSTEETTEENVSDTNETEEENE